MNWFLVWPISGKVASLLSLHSTKQGPYVLYCHCQRTTCLNIVAGGQFLILRLPASMYNVVRGKVIAPDHATKRTLHAGGEEIKDLPILYLRTSAQSRGNWQSSLNLQLLIPSARAFGHQEA